MTIMITGIILFVTSVLMFIITIKELRRRVKEKEDSIDSFTEGGTYYGDGSICCDDLFLKQNSVFANVYNTNGIITVGKCYPTEAEAKSEPAAKKNTYVKTLEITIG